MSPSILKPTDTALQALFFESSPLPCFIVQGDTLNIVKTNAAAAAFFNSTQLLLQTKSFASLLAAEENSTAYGLFKKLRTVAGGESIYLRCKTGSGTASVQVFQNAIPAEEGLIGLVLVAVATPENIDEKELFVNMVNEISDVLTSCDLEFKPITRSNAAEQLFGITREQEALNNIIKHAHASAAQITLSRHNGAVLLEVCDNGQGFAPETMRKGLGLYNIRNRAELFGGKLTIKAVPGAGCTLKIMIPDLPVNAV